ncbi:MAG: hypothetical protein ACLFQB_05045 [Chitinispirillaceae bacterium]
MRKSIGLLILIFSIVTMVRVLASGVHAWRMGTIIPFLFMLPATLSMLVSLVFVADRVHFRWFGWSMVPVAVTAVSLFLLSLLLLIAGNSLVPKVNTLSLIPAFMMFAVFPLSIPFAEKYKRFKQDEKKPEKPEKKEK